MDMTYGSQGSVGEAYLGFDFGTSNSSFSYVERGQVKTYTDRAKEKDWLELNELVSTLHTRLPIRLVGSWLEHPRRSLNSKACIS